MSNDAMKPITWQMCDCATFYDSQDKIDACIADGHGIPELTRLREENAMFRAVLGGIRERMLTEMESEGFNQDTDDSWLLDTIDEALSEPS